MLPLQEQQRTIGDLLIELYVRHAQACGPEGWHRLRRLEAELTQAGAPGNSFVRNRRLP
jgi:hypothetical protein